MYLTCKMLRDILKNQYYITGCSKLNRKDLIKLLNDRMYHRYDESKCIKGSKCDKRRNYNKNDVFF